MISGNSYCGLADAHCRLYRCATAQACACERTDLTRIGTVAAIPGNGRELPVEIKCSQQNRAYMMAYSPSTYM